MNTRQIEYFLAVADELSFTRAAEKLYVSQTAVTQQIRALEEQMGVQLFSRTKKKVELTPAGELFRIEGRRILEHIDNAFTHARDASMGMTGGLEIGFANYASNILSNSLQEFHDRYPNIRLHFRSYNPSVLLDRLKLGELDMIFSPVFDPTVYEECVFQEISGISLIAVLPSNHPLAGRHTLTRQDLGQENLILACTPDSKIGEDRLIINSFLQIGLQPNIVDRIEDAETILLMVAVGMGVSILPSYITLPVTNDRRIVAIPYEPDVHVHYAAISLTENDNPALKIMQDFLKERR
jgi:LysR family transcriptional activator of glutamate synthase operon